MPVAVHASEYETVVRKSVTDEVVVNVLKDVVHTVKRLPLASDVASGLTAPCDAASCGADSSGAALQRDSGGRSARGPARAGADSRGTHTVHTHRTQVELMRQS